MVPTGAVVMTVYMLMKRYFDNQQQTLLAQQLSMQRSDAVEIKLQAYERLILFMERIDLTQLLLRLRTNSMSNLALYNALMVAVQKEFEHNQVQQLYVSDSLWEIVKTAKDNVLSTIINQYEIVNPNDNSETLASALLTNYSIGAHKSINTAISAIKKETRLLL